jgi:hypothetical protein
MRREALLAARPRPLQDAEIGGGEVSPCLPHGWLFQSARSGWRNAPQDESDVAPRKSYWRQISVCKLICKHAISIFWYQITQKLSAH